MINLQEHFENTKKVLETAQDQTSDLTMKCVKMGMQLRLYHGKEFNNKTQEKRLEELTDNAFLS